MGEPTRKRTVYKVETTWQCICCGDLDQVVTTNHLGAEQTLPPGWKGEAQSGLMTQGNSPVWAMIWCPTCIERHRSVSDAVKESG